MSARLRCLVSRLPVWKMAVIGLLAVALIAGLVIAIRLLTEERQPALALDPELMVSLYFEEMSPALLESLQRGEPSLAISPDVERRILQAIPEGSEIGHVVEVNGTYHAAVTIEKGPEYAILAEVILKGDRIEVIEFPPIAVHHLVYGGHRVEPYGIIMQHPDILSPEIQERILREVPGAIEIISAAILDADNPRHAPRVERYGEVIFAWVWVEEKGKPKAEVKVILGEERIRVDYWFLPDERDETVLRWELRRDVLSIILMEGAVVGPESHIAIPQEAQQRMLDEVGGEIIFALTSNHIHRAVVRIEENGKPKYVQAILEGDEIEIGLAEVNYIAFIEELVEIPDR